VEKAFAKVMCGGGHGHRPGPNHLNAVPSILHYMVMLLLRPAQLHGSYAMLKAGLCYEAMIDMTGLPFEKIYFRDEETQELIRWVGVGWGVRTGGRTRGWTLLLPLR